METRIATRMGDGSLTEMTRGELRGDIEDATQLAARKAKVDPLTQDEQDHLLDIYASTACFTAVDIGDQVVLSCDGGGSKMTGTDILDLLESEQRLGQDILELWHIEYSYKAVKTILPHQQQMMQNAQHSLVALVDDGIHFYDFEARHASMVGYDLHGQVRRVGRSTPTRSADAGRSRDRSNRCRARRDSPAVPLPAMRSASSMTARMPRSSMSRMVKTSTPDLRMYSFSKLSTSRIPTSTQFSGCTLGEKS